jgi:peptidoglycan/LPS O-acetylase OafA/YrhL
MKTRRRLDIQGMRAVAVLLVVAYHVRPDWIPGGFVGVDIFFVISGYLITAGLIAEALARGHVDVVKFWGRRVRRLIPASSTVLVAVVVGTVVTLPMTQWVSVFTQTAASAVSVQNWSLLFSSVDYLHPTQPSPLQHFWSLSVEEQFYIVWPFVLWLLVVMAHKRRHSGRKYFAYAVGTLLFASLVFSIAYSFANPSAAYFSTFSRAWELLIGAALAVVLPRVALGRRLSAALLVSGMAVIAASAFFIDDTFVFPGYIALVPTLAAAALIASGATDHNLLPARVLTVRPMTWVGDISYSLYLWHWPLIVFAAAVLGVQKLPFWAVGIVVVLAFTLAALSKWLIEDRFIKHAPSLSGAAQLSLEPKPAHARRAAHRRRFAAHPLTIGLSFLAVVALALGAGVVRYEVVAAEQRRAASPANYPGYEIANPTFDASKLSDLAVTPIPLAVDLATIPAQFQSDCLASAFSEDFRECSYGDPDSATTVVLAGDSHSSMFVPTFEGLAEKHDWKITVIAKGSCSLSVSDDIRFGDGITKFDQCIRWNAKAMERIEEIDPSLVVVSPVNQTYPLNLEPDDLEGHDRFDHVVADGYRGAFAELLDAGLRVVAIKETPSFHDFRVPDCVLAPGATVAECSEKMAETRENFPSRVLMAAQAEPRLPVLDLDEIVCAPDGVCQPVVGNVLTLLDGNHLTEPYARSVAWLVDEKLKPIAPQLYR